MGDGAGPSPTGDAGPSAGRGAGPEKRLVLCWSDRVLVPSPLSRAVIWVLLDPGALCEVVPPDLVCWALAPPTFPGVALLLDLTLP